MKTHFIPFMLFGIFLITKADPNVRLYGGNSTHNGIIQIFYNQTWRTIWIDTTMSCHWVWMYSLIACKSLNYSKSISVGCVPFNPNLGPAYPYLLHCLGNEQNFDECHSQYNDYNRASMMLAFNAECGNLTKDEKAMKVRLVGENKPNYGIVEILFQGMWRRIIETFTFWNIKSAHVVCKMLGFKGALSPLYYPYVNGSSVNKGSILDKIRCSGKEKSIAECGYASWWHKAAYEDYYAGALCQKEQEASEPFQARLTGGYKPNVGQVEIRYHGVWGTICDHRLSDATYDVICRMVGYPGQDKTQYIYYRDINAPKQSITWLYKIKCNGTEESLLDCSHANIGRAMYLCKDRHNLDVICKLASPPQFTLSGCGPRLTVTNISIGEGKDLTFKSHEVFILDTPRSLYQYSSELPFDSPSIMLGNGNRLQTKVYPEILKNGTKHWITLRTVFQHKSGRTIYSEFSRRIPFTVTFCPTNTTQGPIRVHETKAPTSPVAHSQATIKTMASRLVVGMAAVHSFISLIIQIK